MSFSVVMYYPSKSKELILNLS